MLKPESSASNRTPIEQSGFVNEINSSRNSLNMNMPNSSNIFQPEFPNPADVSISNWSLPPNVSNTMYNVNLPPCEIDDFHGDFLSWPTFRDLFSAMFINNSRLSDIERLCHLVQKTIGETREIVSKFPLTHKSFAMAWQSLKDTYDSKRILVHNHLKLLFDLPFIESESSSNLKILQRSINGCISAMSVYDVATDHWDPILVYICQQRLPKLTVALWEQCIKDKSSLSPWEDLNKFLTERIQTLACLRHIRSSPSSPISKSKIKAQ
ncbi:uncharacterized protein LOC133327512 [Musca vetustissima]|uniref:uncharacterized protein LOC133327512 n=1 Tax=Musca vetustissima TaxID=27455 RepID=UPI002AB75500|nr:uncharacterized protein LOC133327512 [Musca vetustissima]